MKTIIQETTAILVNRRIPETIITILLNVSDHRDHRCRKVSNSIRKSRDQREVVVARFQGGRK
jgi:hypothetical protein